MSNMNLIKQSYSFRNRIYNQVGWQLYTKDSVSRKLGRMYTVLFELNYEVATLSSFEWL